MPLVEQVTILLPRASDLGNTIIATRRYDLTVFVNRQGYFVSSRLEKMTVSPKWAKVRLDLFAASVKQASYSALDGIAELAVDLEDDEETALALYNDSPDTDATIVLQFRSWQISEV